MRREQSRAEDESRAEDVISAEDRTRAEERRVGPGTALFCSALTAEGRPSFIP